MGDSPIADAEHEMDEVDGYGEVQTLHAGEGEDNSTMSNVIVIPNVSLILMIVV